MTERILTIAVGLVAMASPLSAAGKGPVKVFILSGQSNMQGKAAASTLDAVIDDPKTRDEFKHLRKDGEWVKRDDVWVTFLDNPGRGGFPTHGPLTVGYGSDYVAQMAHFIRDMRKDLKAPKMPVVIGELGTDGPGAEGWVATFRNQQAEIAALPEFKGTVKLAKTAQYWPSNLPDMQDKWDKWDAFRAAGKVNEAKPKDDPTRIDPGDFFNTNWVQR